ncbi:MAG: tRNA adenosine(34) deaminase TadA [Thermodesulfobacteriota bacterium]
MSSNHEYYMGLALEEAKQAGKTGEIPIGAVIIDDHGKILARARNRVIERSDPTAHSEILALQEAGQKLGNYRLLNTTLYVSIEPCPMCVGAMVHARVSRLVFGARDLKWGAAGSLYDLCSDTRLNHRIEVVTGVLENQSRELMQQFFQEKRR